MLHVFGNICRRNFFALTQIFGFEIEELVLGDDFCYRQNGNYSLLFEYANGKFSTDNAFFNQNLIVFSPGFLQGCRKLSGVAYFTDTQTTAPIIGLYKNR